MCKGCTVWRYQAKISGCCGIWQRWMFGDYCMDTQTFRKTGWEVLSQSICLSAVLFTKHPTLRRCKQILYEGSSSGLSSKSDFFSLKTFKWLICPLSTRKQFEAWLYILLEWSVCSVITCLFVLQPADPLEETDLPGIVYRLSSLTITKALIRLDSSSSAGSDGSLADFVSVFDVVRVCF